MEQRKSRATVKGCTTCCVTHATLSTSCTCDIALMLSAGSPAHACKKEEELTSVDVVAVTCSLSVVLSTDVRCICVYCWLQLQRLMILRVPRPHLSDVGSGRLPPLISELTLVAISESKLLVCLCTPAS